MSVNKINKTILKLDQFKPENLVVDSDRDKTDDNPEIYHQFSDKDCNALWGAYAANRPLLLGGQPGTGKTQMAKAIAYHLGWAFVSDVINGNSELSDLHWSYDAVARLGEAQTLALTMDKEDHKQKDKVLEQINPQKYLAPGAFWWAFDWETAYEKFTQCESHFRCSPTTPGKPDEIPKGVVILIDEIDKANPDLPNGLLETLADLKFSVPYLDEEIAGDPTRLLVIFTTNNERDLPRAFLRRCFVHSLSMDETMDNREQWLIDRGKLHFKGRVSKYAYATAAKMLWDDRDNSTDQQYKPGLAEYIDLLKAISTLDKTEQEARLEEISSFALNKEFTET